MKETFFLQRKDINDNQPIEIIKGRWPCLFSIKHYFNHFEVLTVSNPRDQLTKSLNEKGQLLLDFFQSETQITEISAPLHLISLAMGHLKEPQDSLILVFEVIITNICLLFIFMNTIMILRH